MKIVSADDNFGHVVGDFLDLVSPFAGGFEGGFDRFGTAIHRQDAVRVGHFADFFIEGTQLIVTKSPGDQGKLFGLFDQGSQDAWMAMALVEG